MTKYYGYGKEDFGDKKNKEKKPGLLKLNSEDIWNVTKQCAGLIAGGCASVMMHKYLKTSIPEGNTAFEKIATSIGIYFVSGMISSKVEKYVKYEMDELMNSIKEADAAMKKAKENEDD